MEHASLSTSVRRRPGVAGYIAPEDASPRRHIAPEDTPPRPQQVYSSRAADDLYHNQSTAIALQTTSTTTSLQPSRCRRPLPRRTVAPQTSRRRAADTDDNYYHHYRKPTTITADVPPLSQYHHYRRRTVGY